MAASLLHFSTWDRLVTQTLKLVKVERLVYTVAPANHRRINERRLLATVLRYSYDIKWDDINSASEPMLWACKQILTIANG